MATPDSAREPDAVAIAALPPHPLWLLGEQHDAPAHQSLQKDVVRTLAAQGRLAALVIEMAEAGRDTGGLGQDAPEARVREALGWTADRGGWPWDTYRDAIMAAVKAGVAVHGGNLPRPRQREVMADASLDRTLDHDSLVRQQALVRDGHCGLLPESQIAPMTRIQLARDRSMAQQAQRLVQPGKTVLLIAGNEHVRRDLGVPRHLDPALPLLVLQARSRPHNPSVTDGQAPGPAPQADFTWLTEPVPERDYCGELRRQLAR
ncbi:MAG: hypothetical protein EP306_13995 [Burkholderiales bacterium]|nr:MAG: hypothetical protein EP306_13995 [Burkholderiales bacterium]